MVGAEVHIAERALGLVGVERLLRIVGHLSHSVPVHFGSTEPHTSVEVRGKITDRHTAVTSRGSNNANSRRHHFSDNNDDCSRPTLKFVSFVLNLSKTPLTFLNSMM